MANKKPKTITEGFLYPVEYKRIPSLNEIVVFVVIRNEKRKLG